MASLCSKGPSAPGNRQGSDPLSRCARRESEICSDSPQDSDSPVTPRQNPGVGAPQGQAPTGVGGGGCPGWAKLPVRPGGLTPSAAALGRGALAPDPAFALQGGRGGPDCRALVNILRAHGLTTCRVGCGVLSRPTWQMGRLRWREAPAAAWTLHLPEPAETLAHFPGAPPAAGERCCYPGPVQLLSSHEVPLVPPEGRLCSECSRTAPCGTHSIFSWSVCVSRACLELRSGGSRISLRRDLSPVTALHPGGA